MADAMSVSIRNDWYRALDLAERLEAPASKSCSPAGDSYSKACARLERWRNHPVFRKDASLLRARLHIDGLDEATLLDLLAESPEQLQARSPRLPSMLVRAAELIEAAEPEEESLHDLISGASQDIFSIACLRVAEPLAAAAVNRLRKELAKLLDSSTDRLLQPSAALHIWLETLAPHIGLSLMRTLALEVNIARLTRRLTAATTEDRFREFIDQLCQPERRRMFFREYPVIARHIQQTLEHWVGFGLAFFSHLVEDFNEIHGTLWPNDDPGELVEIEAGAGDLHCGGRSVLRLRFSSGSMLIYKPRGLRLDVHFQQLLTWLNAKRDALAPGCPAFRTMKILDRGDHGWCEFIDSRGCGTRAEVERFYWRQGAYLAVLYAMEASDFHSENLIASGEHPVLVDLEALFHPRTLGLEQMPVDDPARDAWLNSVCRVGLLPQREGSTREHVGRDLSGLGDRPGQTLADVTVMEKLGTDEMHVASRDLLLEANPNIAMLDGKPVNVADYLEQVLDGFASTYRLLVATREELVTGPLEAFRDDEIRVILVPTEVYAAIIRASFHPHYLRDALERDRILDRIWLRPEMGDQYARIFPAERKDLQAGDIPYFTSRAGSRDLMDSHGSRIPEFSPASGFDGSVNRIRGLNEDDLKRQTACIRAAFATIPLDQDESRSPLYSFKTPARRVPPRQLLQMAEAVGERLAEQAIHHGPRASWLGVSPHLDREWRFMPVGYDLYNGATGIALFLAYLGKFGRNPAYHTLARAALATTFDYVDPLENADESVPVGLFSGLGGPIYVLAHLGSLWREPALLDRAEQIALGLERHALASKEFGLLDGVAGFLTSVLTLHHVRPSSALLDLARRCGDRLVANALPSPHLAGLHWPSEVPCVAPLAGPSHGVGGIALSLLRLWARSGEEAYRRCAIGALEYERSVYSPAERNWPDFRALRYPASVKCNGGSALRDPAFVPRFKTAWCHGAPGVGMTRVAMLPFLDDPRLRCEIDIAVNTTLREGFGDNHSLCHGDLGNLELLLTAPDRGALDAEIERLTDGIAASIIDNGWITGIPNGFESPGMMSGIAGMGYELLRLFAPGDVPSILLLDPPGIDCPRAC